ncbi:RNA polymerase sigma factor [Herpetosiphon giganteus]|uniref:RNA polymerase sigma factor n=1 Tax=Herpetosiphon giganteus TaxID=2029754 RepID=UPI00195E80BE|nr:sigma-70 family RNA polymerase sigma factor [Herpetosiphon giganteus]MBM7841807.1 RNA polymerase sigma factor (sigma-70 family) [Herpetosiphon giganteus]
MLLIQDLVEQAQQGDHVALQQLLHHYQPDVTRFARRVCATPEDVEDAVQEALWIATRKIGALRVAGAFSRWLFQVVKHECYRLMRQLRGNTSLSEQLALSMAQTDQSELSHDLALAISNLAPLDCQVLVLRDIQALTTPEVAAQLGLSQAAVKSRLHRARQQLRQTLTEQYCLG